jgi:hypothetical protein
MRIVPSSRIAFESGGPLIREFRLVAENADLAGIASFA